MSHYLLRLEKNENVPSASFSVLEAFRKGRHFCGGNDGVTYLFDFIYLFAFFSCFILPRVMCGVLEGICSRSTLFDFFYKLVF